MKKTSLILILGIFTFALSHFQLFATDVIVPYYSAKKVAPHTYVIHGPLGSPSIENLGFMNNPAFIITKAGVVVVDPGSSLQVGEMLLRQIEKITSLPIVAVFATHEHGDHWLANDAIRRKYPAVKIYGNPKMIDNAKNGGAEFWINLMLNATNHATEGTVAEIPELQTSHARTLAIGDLHFKTFHYGHAHTVGDLMVKVVEDDLLFLGDVCNHQRIGRIDDGTFKGTIAVLETLMQNSPKVFVPGHGPTGGKKVISDCIAFYKPLYQKVAELYEDGQEAFEMKKEIGELLQYFKHWSGFENELGKHISLAVLEVEAAEFE